MASYKLHNLYESVLLYRGVSLASTPMWRWRHFSIYIDSEHNLFLLNKQNYGRPFPGSILLTAHQVYVEQGTVTVHNHYRPVIRYSLYQNKAVFFSMKLYIYKDQGEAMLIVFIF